MIPLIRPQNCLPNDIMPPDENGIPIPWKCSKHSSSGTSDLVVLE